MSKHSQKREKDRRKRQIKAGQLKKENGLISKKKSTK